MSVDVSRVWGILCAASVSDAGTNCQQDWIRSRSALIESNQPNKHPAEVLARPYEADTRQFHNWVLQLEDIDPERISRRVLVSLYAEFCDVFELRPMPWGRFLGAVTSIKGLQR